MLKLVDGGRQVLRALDSILPSGRFASRDRRPTEGAHSKRRRGPAPREVAGRGRAGVRGPRRPPLRHDARRGAHLCQQPRGRGGGGPGGVAGRPEGASTASRAAPRSRPGSCASSSTSPRPVASARPAAFPTRRSRRRATSPPSSPSASAADDPSRATGAPIRATGSDSPEEVLHERETLDGRERASPTCRRPNAPSSRCATSRAADPRRSAKCSRSPRATSGYCCTARARWSARRARKAPDG